MIPEPHDRAAVQGPFLHALVIAPASHRAIDETLSDWRAEIGQASPGLARIVCHLRSGLALARVLLLSLPREIGTVPIALLSLRFALVALIVAVATNVHPLDRLWSFRYLVTFSGALWLPYLLTLLATRALLAFLPLVWFFTAAWPAREPMSRTGLCVAMGISAALLTGLAGFEVSGLRSLITGQGLMTPGGALAQIGRPILTFNFVQFYLAWVVGLGLLGTTVGSAYLPPQRLWCSVSRGSR